MTTTIKNAIILAGGKGTRLSEQTKKIPKPLVKVGPDPAIFHIIRHFVKYGVTNIYIAGGYKVEMIIDTFAKKFNYNNVNNKSLNIICDKNDLLYKAHITVVDTGYSTSTAQRIKQVLPYLPKDHKETFVTYGDTFSNVNLNSIEKMLYQSGNIAILTAATFFERFGIMTIDKSNQITKFAEKSQSKNEFINGGYIACRENLDKYIYPTDDDFSKDTLPRLGAMNKIGAFIHHGFWFPMDSQRDFDEINRIYKQDPNNFLK